MQNFQKMKDFLSHDAPALICCAVEDIANPSRETISISIHHEVSTAPSDTEINSLELRKGPGSALGHFLEQFGSVRLYCDDNSESSAYYLARLDEWQILREELLEWLSSLSPHEYQDVVPNWFDHSIVFGEVPQSGNYLLLCLSGENSGKVFEFEHDGCEIKEVAGDLYQYAEYLCEATENLLRNIASHTRYSDSVTETQWIPIDYVHGKRR